MNGYNGTGKTVGGVTLERNDDDRIDTTRPATPASPGVEFSGPLGALRGKVTRGQRIKALLDYHRMSPTDLAIVLGVSPSTAYHWCGDRYAPSLDNLTTVAQWLEVDPAVIEHGLRAAIEPTPVERKAAKRRKRRRKWGKTETKTTPVPTPAEALVNGQTVKGTVIRTEPTPVRVEPEPVTVSAVAVEVLPAVTLDPSQVWIIAEVGRLMEQMNTAQRKAVMQVARVLIDTAHGV